MGNISFNFSGEWRDVRQVLRSFSTKTVLMRISEEAIALKRNANDNGSSVARQIKYDLINTTTRATEMRQLVITIWGLIELAYYTILASNDYRGKRQISNEEFFVLFDAVEGMRQKNEKRFLDTIEAGSKEVFMYMCGFAGEQFKAQEQGKIFENVGRELYILFESCKQLGDSAVDVSAIVREEFGMEWNKVLCSLLLGWVCSTINCRITEPTFSFDDTSLLSKEDYLKVISKYSVSYESLRQSGLKRQALYTKPYIITQNGETLGILPYLNLCLYEHAILWIVRDHYNKQHDQGFTAYFGKCFEKYFVELLSTYLSEDEFEKIPEENTPRADWKLLVGRHRFLIEQKSALVRLSVKQQAPSLNDIEDYSRKTLIKAIRQLNNTEKEYASGQFIKIILLYDNYLMPIILEQVFSMEECDVESDDHYWLVTIEEMEMLLGLCSKDRNAFNTIIEEKNRQEISHSADGKSLLQIMHKHGITQNGFLERDEITRYRDLASELIKRLLHHSS